MLPQAVLRGYVALRKEEISKLAASMVGTPCPSRLTVNPAERGKRSSNEVNLAD